MSFAPGTKQEYNNFNFAVTGMIIEAASGMKYLKYMKQKVFGPLHMDRTGYRILSRNEATGYKPGKGNPKSIQHQMKGGTVRNSVRTSPEHACRSLEILRRSSNREVAETGNIPANDYTY